MKRKQTVHPLNVIFSDKKNKLTSHAKAYEFISVGEYHQVKKAHPKNTTFCITLFIRHSGIEKTIEMVNRSMFCKSKSILK